MHSVRYTFLASYPGSFSRAPVRGNEPGYEANTFNENFWSVKCYNLQSGQYTSTWF